MVKMQERTDGVTCDSTIAPTLLDLYQELNQMQSDLASELMVYLESYTLGSFNIFAKRTNVSTRSRLVVYDLKRLTAGIKPLALYVCCSQIWDAMMENQKYKRPTYFYVDEFHLLLSIPTAAAFVEKIWRMARKWYGVPTGITQSTEELVTTSSGRAIFNNTSFIIMLSESEADRNNLASLLHLSDEQVKRLATGEKGQGLIYNGKIVIPFKYDFPKNTQLYSIMTTSGDGV